MKVETRTLGLGFLALACSLLGLAFLAICLHSGTFWPWTKVVHEDGARTLLGTIFYFEHAARELPLDIFLGVGVGASFYFAFPPGRAPDTSAALNLPTLAVLSACVIAVIVGGTLWIGGWPLLAENLLQNHTRPGAPLIFGSHWRYHLLERLPEILLSLGGAGLLLTITDDGHRKPGRAGFAAMSWTVAIFLAVTIALSPSPSTWGAPFFDPQYLGHEAREIFTHVLVSLPIGWSACLLLTEKGARRTVALTWPPRFSRLVTASLLAGAAGTAAILYAGLAAVLAQSASYGQTDDFVTLVAPHFFEHSFTYLVVPIFALLAYAGLAEMQKK